MRLYLVQHGEAKSKDQDPDRPLTDEGIRNAKKIASFLAPLNLSINTAWHSGKLRTDQTAAILACSIAASQNVVRRDGLGPSDPIGPIKDELIRMQEDLMIVGHLPFLALLASALLGTEKPLSPIAFRNAGVLCLERNDNGRWSICWMIVPELLR